MIADLGSNRLPELAALVRQHHAGVEVAARAAAEHAIAAGAALLEAKKLLKHGAWLPWLKEHCQVSERTAQLYMKIVRLGLKSETVADLGIKAAGKVIAKLHYDPFAGCDDAAIRRWHIFALYFTEFGVCPTWAMDHVCWLRRQDFNLPEDFLALEPKPAWMPAPSERFKVGWPSFFDATAKLSDAKIAEALEAAEERHEIDRRPKRRRRRA